MMRNLRWKSSQETFHLLIFQPLILQPLTFDYITHCLYVLSSFFSYSLGIYHSQSFCFEFFEIFVILLEVLLPIKSTVASIVF